MFHSLGFASVNEKRTSQRYNRTKRRKSIAICDSESTVNVNSVGSSVKAKFDTLNQSKNVATSTSTVNIDYEKIEEERRLKLEELQSSNMEEKEVKKRIKKRKKLTNRLLQKTKHGQPLMGNHVSHLLQKIQGFKKIKVT